MSLRNPEGQRAPDLPRPERANTERQGRRRGFWARGDTRGPYAPRSLRNSPLGLAIPRRELNRLDNLGMAIEITQGEQIIRRSSIGRECFVVIDGEFAVVGEGFTGAIGSGEVAGELALLTGRPRNASVESAADSVVYALHPQEFATLLSDAPTFRGRVLRSASERLGVGRVPLPAQLLPGHERRRS